MSQENPMVYDLLVNNALLFDGSAVRDGLLSVGIAGNKISFVGASAAQASKEIDAAGRFLMPGLIDCHVHLMNMWTAKDEATMAIDIERELPQPSEGLARERRNDRQIGR
jgi:imidazolonepropionase-like amidohydrolase